MMNGRLRTRGKRKRKEGTYRGSETLGHAACVGATTGRLDSQSVISVCILLRSNTCARIEPIVEHSGAYINHAPSFVHALGFDKRSHVDTACFFARNHRGQTTIDISIEGIVDAANVPVIGTMQINPTGRNHLPSATRCFDSRGAKIDMGNGVGWIGHVDTSLYPLDKGTIGG